MAIQFPNFLGVPLVKSDYSGIGDSVSNYYAGKAMPKDDLIKQIQAQFARPNAEQTLEGLRLGNQGTGLTNQKMRLEIEKYRYDLAKQREMENLIANAMRGGNAGASQPQQGISSQQNMPSMPQTPQMAPPAMDGSINPALASAIQQQMRPNPNLGIAPTAPPSASNAPMMQSSSQMPETSSQAQQAIPESTASNNAQIITQGEPRYAGMDALWDQNPLSREFLKKKGFEKKTEIKFDQKTGQTRILTTYPSGKISLQTFDGAGGANGEAPLTTANVTKQQSIVNNIDNTLPVIKDILSLDKNTKSDYLKKWEAFPRNSGWQPGLGWVPGYHSASTNYESLVSSALDTLLGAYGLPKTNEGIETVKKQLLIGHGETDAQYKNRLNRLIKDLERRKEYSSSLLKKASKNPSRDTGSNETYSSDEWETANE
jgi:hypothetical protein